jgi:hypothetical protein
MSNNVKPNVKFELQLSAADEEGYLVANLVNNTDKKFRIVDVMRGAMWHYAGEKYYADEKFMLLAPVIPRAEIAIAYFSVEDLKTSTYIFIDVYDGDRSVEPERYLAVVEGLDQFAEKNLVISKMLVPFKERSSDFKIRDRSRARDIKPQIRKMVSRRLDKAVAIAAMAHAEQLRKGSEIPYIVPRSG